jgi:aspartate-semialdehyde dehydrogenase
MSKEWKIAVVGATGLVGESLLKVLAERRFPVAAIHALASDRSLGRTVEFGDDELRVGDVATFDFATVDFALFAASEAAAQEHVPRALEAGCTVVDASAAFRADPDVPLIVPAVNGEALGRLGERRLVACPGGAAVALVTVLCPLHAAVGVERVNVVSLQAVSGAGREAVEDLASQCAQLLNGRSPGPSPHFGAQIAFNVIPQIGTPDADGATAEEDALAFETQKILGDPAIKVNATALRVPVFFGDGLAVHLETREPLTVGRARELLAQAPGLVLADAPTPQDAVADPGAVAVGRLRADRTHPRGLDLWLAADNVRRGSAANTVDVVEVLVRDCF